MTSVEDRIHAIELKLQKIDNFINFVMNHAGEKGDTGETGDTGDTGEKGEKGDTGNTGKSGYEDWQGRRLGGDWESMRRASVERMKNETIPAQGKNLQ
jgi:hypothetical protein